LQRVLTTVTLLGLLVATAAAFAITEHLKLVKSDVAGVEIPLKVFSPICRGPDTRCVKPVGERAKSAYCAAPRPTEISAMPACLTGA